VTPTRFALLSTTARIMPRTGRKQAREDARLMAWIASVLDGMLTADRGLGR
jgi:hypothetical protein